MEAIRKQAFVTFSKNGMVGNHFQENLTKLHCLMNSLNASDVKLDHNLLTTPISKHRMIHAPVSYVEILDSPNFTINMFVLRPGSRLPLHDHPMMYGICKIIHGKVKIKSYSLKSDVTCLLYKHYIEAYREPDLFVGENDEAILLTPEKRNIHEIQSVDGPAAFVDVLAPPYRTQINGYGPRPCHYYIEVEKEEEKEVRHLIKTEKAPDYWTETAPYLGP